MDNVGSIETDLCFYSFDTRLKNNDAENIVETPTYPPGDKQTRRILPSEYGNIISG